MPRKAVALPGPPAWKRARTRRLWSTLLWWIFIGVFVYNAVGLGQAFFWAPALLFGLGAAATTRLALSPQAPERFTPEPGALADARKGRVVEAPATWVPRPDGRPTSGQRGVLRVADGKIGFVTDDDETGFETPVKKVHLESAPGFMRPQLDLQVDGSPLTIRFFPVWDLGATFVGPVVAMEWYRQLRATGAT